MKRVSILSQLKREWEEATRAALYAASVSRKALNDLEAGVTRELPPELHLTAEELEAVAVQKRQAYLEALAQELMCTQLDERQRRSTASHQGASSVKPD